MKSHKNDDSSYITGKKIFSEAIFHSNSRKNLGHSSQASAKSIKNKTSFALDKNLKFLQTLQIKMRGRYDNLKQ